MAGIVRQRSDVGSEVARRAMAPRRDSRALLFGLIHARQQTTRTRLVRESGLSKATVSSVVGELLAEGLVHEVGKHQGGRGRSQVLLEVDPQARLVLGAQVADHACTVILADLYARVERETVVPVQGTTPQDVVDAVCKGVEALRPHAGAPLLGLGVGAPGSVDAAGRHVTISVPHGWSNVPLADLLEDRLGVAVRVANRAKVAALGEHWHRMGQGIEHLAYVYVGDGIVAGMVIGGSLYFGNDGLAGELGHVTVLPDGPVCDCGNRGCLHVLASSGAIAREVRASARAADRNSLVERLDRSPEREELKLILEAARQGDRVAAEALAAAGRYLGIAIASLINLFNPEVVVVGGPIGRAGELVVEPVRSEVRRRALRDALIRLEIVPPAFESERAGALGAAALFLDQLETIA